MLLATFQLCEVTRNRVSLLAMTLLRRAVHHGCSEPFKQLVESVIPREYLFSGLPSANRTLDFLEIFAGAGNLSQALANASWFTMIVHVWQSTRSMAACQERGHTCKIHGCKVNFNGIAFDRVYAPNHDIDFDDGKRECHPAWFMFLMAINDCISAC